jgi:hypothetical protein
MADAPFRRNERAAGQLVAGERRKYISILVVRALAASGLSGKFSPAAKIRVE